MQSIASTGSSRSSRSTTFSPPRGVLLTMGNHDGTLAAARDLGRQGTPVVLADSGGPRGSRSSFVSRRERCPDLSQPKAWLDWLLGFGRREPGHALMATSDDACWLMDAHRDELSQWFDLYAPSQGDAAKLLNKRSLFELCRELGIEQPAQWTAAEALAAAAQLPYPVLVKPGTEAGRSAHGKGTVVASAAFLPQSLHDLRSPPAWRDQLLLRDAGSSELIVQAYHREAEQHIYSLAGFYAPECGTYLLRAARKRKQPMRIETGAQFESCEVVARLANQLRTLMDRTGYRGPFEVEYVHLAAEERYLLIGFNPRFHCHMAFEISRGLPMARLCHLAARGDWVGVQTLALQAQVAQDGLGRFRTAWMLRPQLQEGQAVVAARKDLRVAATRSLRSQVLLLAQRRIATRLARKPG